MTGPFNGSPYEPSHVRSQSRARAIRRTEFGRTGREKDGEHRSTTVTCRSPTVTRKSHVTWGATLRPGWGNIDARGFDSPQLHEDFGAYALLRAYAPSSSRGRRTRKGRGARRSSFCNAGAATTLCVSGEVELSPEPSHGERYPRGRVVLPALTPTHMSDHSPQVRGRHYQVVSLGWPVGGGRARVGVGDLT